MEQKRKAVICLPPDNPDAMTELVPIAVDALAEQEEKEVAEQNIQLSQQILGMEPYILIKLTEVEDDDTANVTLEFGGGFTKETAFGFLKAVVDDSEEA